MELLEPHPLPSGARPPPPQNPPQSSLNPAQILPSASDPFPPRADLSTGGSPASGLWLLLWWHLPSGGRPTASTSRAVFAWCGWIYDCRSCRCGFHGCRRACRRASFAVVTTVPEGWGRAGRIHGLQLWAVGVSWSPHSLPRRCLVLPRPPLRRQVQALALGGRLSLRRLRPRALPFTVAAGRAFDPLGRCSLLGECPTDGSCGCHPSAAAPQAASTPSSTPLEEGCRGRNG